MNKEEWLLPKKFRFIAMNYPEFEEDLKSLLSSTKQQIVNEIVEKGDKLKKKWEWRIMEDNLTGDFNVCKICSHIEYEPESSHFCEDYNKIIEDYQNLIKEQ